MMRQTLWADQMIAHQDEELVQAGDFVHVDVIPRGNEGFEEVEATWREMLTDQSKYVVTTPEDFVSPALKGYSGLRGTCASDIGKPRRLPPRSQRMCGRTSPPSWGEKVASKHFSEEVCV